MEEIRTDYLQGSLNSYLDRLASRDPVPGGGSAGALALSLAAALLSMTANFTVGRKRYREFETQAQEILSRAEAIRREAARLVEEDSAAYLRYRRAVEMDKESPEREKTLLEAVQAGNRVLILVAGFSRQALKLAAPLAEKGNPYLVSDVACAVSLARAAFEIAEMNILINLSSGLKLPEEAQLKDDLQSLRPEVAAESEAILAEIRKRLS